MTGVGRQFSASAGRNFVQDRSNLCIQLLYGDLVNIYDIKLPNAVTLQRWAEFTMGGDIASAKRKPGLERSCSTTLRPTLKCFMDHKKAFNSVDFTA